MALNYVLTLAITTLLISGLLFATGSVLENRRDAVTRSELRVVGEQVSSDLATADRMVQAGGTTVAVRADVPGYVGGSRYTVSLNESSRELVLRTTDPPVTVRVPVVNRTRLTTSEATGTTIQIEKTPGGALEVTSP